MPEPEPAKTKMSMEMNSAVAALRASGWLASAKLPREILEIGITVISSQNYYYYYIFFFPLRKKKSSIDLLLGCLFPS